MSYQPYPANPYQRPPEPSGLSISSLVLGILSMLGFCVIILVPLAGVITGHMGYRREPNSRGMALAGLITSWVGLALAVALYAFFIWAFWFAATSFNEVYEESYSSFA